MIRGCSICQRSPAPKSVCCSQKLCEAHTMDHPCPRAAELLAMDPKRWREENAPEQRLTFQVVAALNLLPGVKVAAFDVGGARQRNVGKGNPGMPDVMGRASMKPWAVLLGIETKNSHTDGCGCDSCVAQRAWGQELIMDGGVYVLARSVQQAVDGVRLGLARATTRMTG